jgi:hypothetical protein
MQPAAAAAVANDANIDDPENADVAMPQATWKRLAVDTEDDDVMPHRKRHTDSYATPGDTNVGCSECSNNMDVASPPGSVQQAAAAVVTVAAAAAANPTV